MVFPACIPFHDLYPDLPLVCRESSPLFACANHTGYDARMNREVISTNFKIILHIRKPSDLLLHLPVAKSSISLALILWKIPSQNWILGCVRMASRPPSWSRIVQQLEEDMADSFQTTLDGSPLMLVQPSRNQSSNAKALINCKMKSQLSSSNWMISESLLPVWHRRASQKWPRHHLQVQASRTSTGQKLAHNFSTPVSYFLQILNVFILYMHFGCFL